MISKKMFLVDENDNLPEDDPQIAENDIELLAEMSDSNFYQDKREKLNTLGIVRQTWSVYEVNEKLKSNIFILEPTYQRGYVWDKAKQNAFIESLFMEISIPPIYIAEIRGSGSTPTKYEVVDGKQRLNTLKLFLDNKLKLEKKHMEYFDIFDGKKFDKITSEFQDLIDKMLSLPLDCYVITSRTEASIRYDVFARINKGAVALTPDELRVALYNSNLVNYLSTKIDEFSADNAEIYNSLFSKRAIKRKKDFGRFFRSIAFSYSFDTYKLEVTNYNSRPKEFINGKLLEFQQNKNCETSEIDRIFYITCFAMNYLKNEKIDFSDHYVDSIVPFFNEIVAEDQLVSIIEGLKQNEEFAATFVKSPSTTSNVNQRMKIVDSFLKEK